MLPSPLLEEVVVLSGLGQRNIPQQTGKLLFRLAEAYELAGRMEKALEIDRKVAEGVGAIHVHKRVSRLEEEEEE